MSGEILEAAPEGRDDEPGEVQAPPRAGPPRAQPRPAAAAPGMAGPPAPAAERAAEHYAGHMAETSASAFMYFSMAAIFRQADALAFKKYRDKLLSDCGDPTDPIEVMMIEQLALAHLNTGRLHYRAATATSTEEARVFGG